MPDDRKYFKSLPGAIATVFTVVVLVGYAGYKMSQFVARSNYQILKEYTDYAIGQDFKFSTTQDGFRVAAGITSYTSEPAIEDPTIGEISFRLRWWDEKEAGTTILPASFCDSDQFNFDGSDS